MKKTLDITRDHCPMTFVKAKLELEKLASGDQLEVLLSGGEPLQNVPRSAAEAGYRVLAVAPAGDGRHTVVIEKP
jgi:tRNA 2-thiouridine synthesizing protein A